MKDLTEERSRRSAYKIAKCVAGFKIDSFERPIRKLYISMDNGKNA